MDNTRIIIVEDELIAAEFLKEILEQHGANVLDIIDTGKEAIRVCTEKNPDIIFMDVMLRDNVSGSEAALAISRQCDSKIIFLTAYVDDEMVDYAVEANAAGYLTKPYNEAQIVATTRLAMKKQGERQTKTKEAMPEKTELKDGYTYLSAAGKLMKNGREVELGPKALRLVGLLSSQPGISFSHEQISMYVWGELVNDRTLRSLVFRIRSVIGDDLIRNVSGSGYMIQAK